jgi:hypothetical protein
MVIIFPRYGRYLITRYNGTNFSLDDRIKIVWLTVSYGISFSDHVILIIHLDQSPQYGLDLNTL